MYSTGSQIKFKTAMLNASWCGYSPHYCVITIPRGSGNDADVNKEAHEKNNNVVFKHYPLFFECINEINNSLVDHGKDLDILLAMYNVIKYSDNYAETSGGLW